MDADFRVSVNLCPDGRPVNEHRAHPAPRRATRRRGRAASARAGQFVHLNLNSGKNETDGLGSSVLRVLF